MNGNPDVIPSSVENIDLRAEWFFANGNSFTVSVFSKEITDPIEYFESPASDTNTARKSSTRKKHPFKGLNWMACWPLAFWEVGVSDCFCRVMRPFKTLKPQRDQTRIRQRITYGLRQARPTTFYNMTVGFDSLDGRHSANLLYNVFGERLYVAGRLGAPDGFEQPFHSLDLNYSFYPSDSWTMKLKVQNVLDETVEIERAGW